MMYDVKRTLSQRYTIGKKTYDTCYSRAGTDSMSTFSLTPYVVPPIGPKAPPYPSVIYRVVQELTLKFTRTFGRTKMLDAKKDAGRISISEGSFEHILNCLDNQKYINDRNADSSTCDADEVQRENQAAIDRCGKECREILHA